jgi:hypothetical protein
VHIIGAYLPADKNDPYCKELLNRTICLTKDILIKDNHADIILAGDFNF